MRRVRALAGLGLLLASTASAQDVVTITEVIPIGSGGVDVDAEGRVYLADFGATLSGGGDELVRVDPDTGDWEVLTTALNGASGNDFNSEGILLQSSITAGRIDEITQDGVVTTLVTAGIAGPVGIAVDENDDLVVCNCGNNTLRKVSADGSSSTLFATSALLSCPNGIDLADDGNYYVANFNNGRVLRVTPGGTVSLFVTIPGGNNGHILAHRGKLYVIARSAHQIYEVTLDGEVSLLAGTGTQGDADGALLDAEFSYPNDLAPDPTGRYLYVNDVVNPFGPSDTSPVILRRVDLDATVSVPVDQVPVRPFRIRSVSPNPFGTETAIAFSLDRGMDVSVTIYDVSGREIVRLLDGFEVAGDHQVAWDATDASGEAVPAGIYLYRLATEAGTVDGRVSVLR